MERMTASDPLSSVGQPASMSEYAKLPNTRKGDNGGVHINSGIPNRVAYLVARAIGPEKMEQIAYRTLTQYLSPNSNFSDAARATIRAAQDLYGQTEANAARQAFTQSRHQRGRLVAKCRRPLPRRPLRKKQPLPTQNLPAGCTNLIANGTFEGDGGWTSIVGKGEDNLIETELPHTGSRSAWLGGTDKESIMYIYQDVKIPANATQIQLAYYRLMHAEKSGLSGLFAGDARFSVLAANTTGDVLGTIEELVSSRGDDTWSQAQFDLSRAGRQDGAAGLPRRKSQRQYQQFLCGRCSVGRVHHGHQRPGRAPDQVAGASVSAGQRHQLRYGARH